MVLNCDVKFRDELVLGWCICSYGEHAARRRHDARYHVSSLNSPAYNFYLTCNFDRLRPFWFLKMSFESLQERLAALQESIAQLRELIDRLANLKYDGDTGNEDDSGELSLEISQVLRDGQDDLKALREEVGYVQAGEHDVERLKEGVEKLGKDLTRYVVWGGALKLSNKIQVSSILPQSSIISEEQLDTS